MASLNHATIIKGFEKLIDETNPAEFFFSFLKALKFSATTIKRLREPGNNRNVAIAPGDYALAKQIYFHPAEAGEDQTATLRSITREEALQKYQIRFFLSTDFENVTAYDRRVDDWVSFGFKELCENYEFFLPLTGLYEKPLAYSAHPADAKACEKMGRLYDEIRNINHYEKEQLHDLNVFLTRLLFCFFAEDTGIFPIEGQLTKAVESLTKSDGSDISEFFERLFLVLDTPEGQCARRQETTVLAAFPYVNGGLFREKIRIPKFSTKARNLLISCGRLEWKEISPVIFGSMFQSVMDPEKRHELGAHYTSEKNIFKVIGPLFLDNLKIELEKLLKDKSTHKVKKLKDFQAKLASILIADPACGCGNFLVVSYRELKLLELKVVEELLSIKGKKDRSIFMDWEGEYSKVSINQFYGIELEELPVEIAHVSLLLMEHVMNRKFGNLLGTVIPSIPLKNSAKIACMNALTTDWGQVFPLDRLSYIVGNPPFAGRPTRTTEQSKELDTITSGIPEARNLDYVCGWYFKAAECMQLNRLIDAAFVSTNSICQGEQVVPLWKSLFSHGIQIFFAHQTFQWKNEAKDNAGVYCVVIGFSRCDHSRKVIYSYKDSTDMPESMIVNRISGYLCDSAEEIFIEQTRDGLSGQTKMMLGNQPTDAGNLIIENGEYCKFCDIDRLRPYIKKLVGAKELLHSLPRYCLWLCGAPKSLLEISIVAERIEKCRTFRLSSKKVATKLSAASSHLFQDRRFDEPPKTTIVVPRVSSERREHIPIGFVTSDTIITDSCYMIPNGTFYDFGILESRMHMTWMRTVCGRLKGDYRYSRDLCYNTFPWPKVSEMQRQLIENLAKNILMIREYYPDMTLADLYDPDKMPNDLRKAHTELDLAVERLYRKKPFASDEERLHHLFARYEKLVKGEDDSTLFSAE